MPWEEPSAYFGGHYNIMFPKNVYWSKVRQAGQPFIGERSGLRQGLPHRQRRRRAADDGRGRRATGITRTRARRARPAIPDLIFDKPYVKNDRYLGVAFKPGMGQDNSEERMCEWRCFDAIDTMNNMYAGSGLRPKYIIADIDTYQKGPGGRSLCRTSRSTT